MHRADTPLRTPVLCHIRHSCQGRIFSTLLLPIVPGVLAAIAARIRTSLLPAAKTLLFTEGNGVDPFTALFDHIIHNRRSTVEMVYDRRNCAT